MKKNYQFKKIHGPKNLFIRKTRELKSRNKEEKMLKINFK